MSILAAQAVKVVVLGDCACLRHLKPIADVVRGGGTARRALDARAARVLRFYGTISMSLKAATLDLSGLAGLLHPMTTRRIIPVRGISLGSMKAAPDSPFGGPGKIIVIWGSISLSNSKRNHLPLFGSYQYA